MNENTPSDENKIINSNDLLFEFIKLWSPFRIWSIRDKGAEGILRETHDLKYVFWW